MPADKEFFDDMRAALQNQIDDCSHEQIEAVIAEIRNFWQGNQVYISYNVDYDERDSAIRAAYQEAFMKICREHHISFSQLHKIVRSAPKHAKEPQPDQTEMDV